MLANVCSRVQESCKCLKVAGTANFIWTLLIEERQIDQYENFFKRTHILTTIAITRDHSKHETFSIAACFLYLSYVPS